MNRDGQWSAGYEDTKSSFTIGGLTLGQMYRFHMVAFGPNKWSLWNDIAQCRVAQEELFARETERDIQSSWWLTPHSKKQFISEGDQNMSDEKQVLFDCKERVAYDLMCMISTHDQNFAEKTNQNAKDYFFRLYRASLRVVRGLDPEEE